MCRFSSSLFAFALVLLLAAPAFSQRDRDTYNPNNQAFEVSGVVSIADSGVAAQNITVRLEKFSGGIIDQMNTDVGAGSVSSICSATTTKSSSTRRALMPRTRTRSAVTLKSFWSLN